MNYIDIGPECFAAADRSVICWQGVNYVPQGDPASLPIEAAALVAVRARILAWERKIEKVEQDSDAGPHARSQSIAALGAEQYGMRVALNAITGVPSDLSNLK